MTSWNALTRLPEFIGDVIRNRRRIDSPPRLLTYTVTFRCNARCIMCDSWKMSGEGDLSVDEIDGIFKQLNRMQAVRLTGGEPFVRKDLFEIVGLVERRLKPLGLHITTNGFLTDRIVDLCERRSKRTPLQLLVSLDGVGEKHNTIRGSSLAWKTAFATLEALAPRRRELNLDLAVNQTIVDREGVEHYKLLREKLAPLGVRHQAVMAYDASATYKLEREVDVAPRQIGQFSTFGEFSDDDFRELFREMESDIKKLPWWARLAKQYYLEGIRQRLLPTGHEEAWLNPTCVALNSHLRIFPNGDVPTCQFNSKTIGNLRDQSFEEVWKGVRAAEQRRWVRQCVGCWAECEVLPSAIYTLDLISRKQTAAQPSRNSVREEQAEEAPAPRPSPRPELVPLPVVEVA